jgi:hypothetical protein
LPWLELATVDVPAWDVAPLVADEVPAEDAPELPPVADVDADEPCVDVAAPDEELEELEELLSGASVGRGTHAAQAATRNVAVQRASFAPRIASTMSSLPGRVSPAMRKP